MAPSLPELDRLERDKLVDAKGRGLAEFRRGLRPNFVRVWFDIMAGHAALGLSVLAIVALDQRFPKLFPLIGFVGGLSVGYWLAFVQLFFHEAAHYNIAPHRALNDLLANAVLGLLKGQSIKAYRVVHLAHHRLLGTPADTEHSYFDALSLRFFVECLTGLRLFRVLLAQRALAKRGRNSADRAAGHMLVAGLMLNLALMGAGAWSRCWSFVLAWPFGMLIVMPTVFSVRQLLEHRSYDATSRVDYTREPHGAVTRGFGTGPLASTLGGAGFNRHHLHHWDPQLSYTNFAALEAFLMETQAAPAIRGAGTTYATALIRLMRAP